MPSVRLAAAAIYIEPQMLIQPFDERDPWIIPRVEAVHGEFSQALKGGAYPRPDAPLSGLQ
jgi:hypothetical protein